jgi:hypothetical protein
MSPTSVVALDLVDHRCSKTMKEPPKKTLRTDPIGDDLDVEMLYAAAEAHPRWEVMPDGTGIRHLGSEAPNTPRELLEWFLKKGRH